MNRCVDLSNIPEVNRLPVSLWGQSAAARRSDELTCLYVQRYSGPRRQQDLTYHPFAELLYVFGGSGTLHGTPPVALHRGTTVLVPPNHLHIECATRALDTLWIGLRGKRVGGYASLCALENVEMEPLLESIWLLGQVRYGRCGPELDGLCAQALGRLGRLREEATAAMGEAELVSRATAYLRRHYTRRLTVSILAAELNVSEGHLHRRFRARTGKTPVAYLTELRLAAAMDMLRHSNLSISRIARLNGFADPLYFARVCRKNSGRAPSGWRDRANYPGMDFSAAACGAVLPAKRSST